MKSFIFAIIVFFGLSFQTAFTQDLQSVNTPNSSKASLKRKVAIASVLASKPQLLVLDEPSSNLDPSSRRELIDILLSLEISIILVTHDLPMALEICPRSIVVNGGSITQDGVTKELLTNDKIMKENRLELPFGFALHHLDEE